MRCKWIYNVTLILILQACENESLHTRGMLRYFEKEVNERMKAVGGSSVIPDTLKQRAQSVHKRIGELILLSKDFENLSASVNLSNEFLTGVFTDAGIRADDVSPLATDMHVNEIAVVLRQNELNFLNRLILKYDSTGRLYTAQ